MPDKAMINYEHFTIFWLTALSLMGGCVQYVRKVNLGLIAKFSIAELVGELAISGFVGFMSFLLCDMYEVDLRMTGVFIGMTSYMGSRSIFLFEYYFKRKIGAITGDFDPDTLKIDGINNKPVENELITELRNEIELLKQKD